jgi:hypothetical protein
MKYTPGPWAAEANGVFKDEQRNPIASVYDPEHTNHLTDIAKANAQLIAAAPDMYEALKDLVKLLECDDPVEVGCSCAYTGTGAPLICAWCKAKQALAKAEGREIVLKTPLF